jgi:RNA polymerase sigma factor (sigma-70 family)
VSSVWRFNLLTSCGLHAATGRTEILSRQAPRTSSENWRVWLEFESQREVVRQAWTKLEPRQAHIIDRSYVEGRSADEIAAETRLEVNHIYVLKHRAIKKLREYCADA